MNWNAEEALSAELLDGESITWMGTPTFWPMLRSKIVYVLFYGMFVGVAVEKLGPWSADGLQGRQSPPGLTVVLGLLFAGFGIYAGGRVIAGVCAYARMAYAVTDRRILVVNHFWTRHVLTFAPDAINIVECREDGGGVGSVLFRRVRVQTADGPQTSTAGFIGVHNVRMAAVEIERLRNQAYRAQAGDSDTR